MVTNETEVHPKITRNQNTTATGTIRESFPIYFHAYKFTDSDEPSYIVHGAVIQGFQPAE